MESNESQDILAVEVTAKVGAPIGKSDSIKVEADPIPDLIPGGEVEAGLVIENAGASFVTVGIEADATDLVEVDVPSEIGLGPGEKRYVSVLIEAPSALVEGQEVKITYRVEVKE